MRTSVSFLFFSNVIHTVTGTYLLHPPGPDIELGTATADITDYSRTNIWAPGGNNTDPRTLQISIFYPVGVQPCSAPYQPEYVPKIVSDWEDAYFSSYNRGVLGTMDYSAFRSQFYKKCFGGNHTKGGYPVLIFSPGYFRTRLLYGVLAQAVAKRGYIVLTIDHPYDSDVVVLESGKVIYGIDDANISPFSVFQTAIDVRVADTKFVLNQLGDPKIAHKLLPSVPYELDTNKVGIFGHSIGGAVAAELITYDDRIVSGINIDGTMFPRIAEYGTDKPFLLLESNGHTRFTDSSWNVTWPQLRGWKAEISLNNSKHSTYGDLGFLLKTLNVSNAAGTNESLSVGTIDGKTAIVDTSTIVADFFDFSVNGEKPSSLLEGDNEGFPDVAYITECVPETGCQY